MQNKTAEQFIQKLESLQSDEELKKYERYFPLASRGNDKFIGVRMGQVFALAKEFIEMPLNEIEELLESPVHEVRVGAVSIMDFQARDKSTSNEHKKELFDLYTRRHDRINTWDLVDRSAIHVVGGYLFDKPRDALYKLAGSRVMAERRTAIVSTFYFIGQDDKDDTFKIAKLLLKDKEDLVHKATGWALRSAGGDELLHFLDENAAVMPRTALRYATEKLNKEQRDHYLKLKK
ncbi:MAG: alkylation repair protein [Candidatus Saccharibacteria bacterium]|nr:alkylation repair protein [Candidatus Saccharibacteria bacterium]